VALREIALDVDDGPVGGGGSGSHYMTAPDESRWVMKSTYFGAQGHKYLYLNEALSAVIGRNLGAPVPEPAVLRLEPEQAAVFKPNHAAGDLLIFATERIDPSESLSAEAIEAVDVSEPASIIVLDVLVWNVDRLGKPEHVLVQPPESGGWRLWAVDHGHTFSVRDALHDPDLHPELVPQEPYDQLLRPLRQHHVAPFIEKAQGWTREDYEGMIRSLPQEWIIEP